MQHQRKSFGKPVVETLEERTFLSAAPVPTISSKLLNKQFSGTWTWLVAEPAYHISFQEPSWFSLTFTKERVVKGVCKLWARFGNGFGTDYFVSTGKMTGKNTFAISLRTGTEVGFSIVEKVTGKIGKNGVITGTATVGSYGLPPTATGPFSGKLIK